MDSPQDVIAALVAKHCPNPAGANAHVKRSTEEGQTRLQQYHMLGQPAEAPETALAGATIPSNIIQTEKPEHRQVVLLKVLGHDTKEIAEQTGYHEVYVKNILAQPWARQHMARILETSETKQLIDLMLANAAAASVRTIIEIRDNPKEAGSVRLKAASDLLDRFRGKPVQQMVVQPKQADTQDDAEIDRRLKELQDRERDLIGRPKVREVTTVIEVQTIGGGAS